MDEPIVVARLIDLPRAIVADAFTDPELAAGWFHPTDAPQSDGATYDLTEVAGGSRGTSTTVTVTAASAGQPTAAVLAAWEHRLDLLENLLRGHPADWTAEARRSSGVA